MSFTRMFQLSLRPMGTTLLGTVLFSLILHCICFKKKRQQTPMQSETELLPNSVSNSDELEFTPMTEKEIAELNIRRPHGGWNGVLEAKNKKLEEVIRRQLICYFDTAKTVILLYIHSLNKDITSILLKKNENENGPLIQVITEYDSWKANPDCGVRALHERGIEIRMRNTGCMMPDELAIIDNEAIITGHLNMTRQDVEGNKYIEVSTDQGIVFQLTQEYMELLATSKKAGVASRLDRTRETGRGRGRGGMGRGGRRAGLILNE